MRFSNASDTSMPMSLWNDIIELFFPRLCPVCGRKLLPDEAGICTGCLLRLPYTGLGNTPGNALEQCFWGLFPIERASTLFVYDKDSPYARLLHAMKYHHQPRLCREMGRLMAQTWKESGFFDGIDCLVPVPLHPDRQRKRGYNQSEELARGLSQVTGIPVCTTAVVRVRNNLSQTHKSVFERWSNTDALFQTVPTAPTWLAGRHILLVDDVTTTGATLTACAEALQGIPGLRISVASLAWSNYNFFGNRLK